MSGTVIRPRILSPIARKVLLAFSWVSACYLTYRSFISPQIHPIFGVVIGILGVGIMWFSTRPTRKYYTPIVFSVYYQFGHVIALAQILAADVFLQSSRHIGDFDFTSEAFLKVVMAICWGLGGIVLATLSAERLSKRAAMKTKYRSPMPFEPAVGPFILSTWVWGWFVVSLAIILFAWYSGINRTGFANLIELPYSLVGIIQFVKAIVLPIVGAFLFAAALAMRSVVLIQKIFVLSAVLGVLGSFGGLSRGYFLTIIQVPVLWLMFNLSYLKGGKKLFIQFAAISLCVLLFLPVLVNALRQTAAYGGDVGISALGQNVGEVSLNMADGVSSFLVLVTDRIGGIKKVMASTAYGSPDLYAPVAIFVSDTIYVKWLQRGVFGYNDYSDSFISFGSDFNSIGMLALSGSNLVILFGMALFALMIIFLEEIFIRSGHPSASLFLALALGVNVWNNIYWSILWRNYAIAFMSLLLLNAMSRRVYGRAVRDNE